MEPITFLLIAALIFGLLYVYRRDPEMVRRRRLIDKLPGLRKYPIAGSLLPYIFMKPEERWDFGINMIRSYKPFLKWWLGPFPTICIDRPEHYETVLNNTKMIDKAEVYKILHPWLGRGLLTSTGLKWHTHRKIITPSFHFKILENFIPILIEKSDILVKKLQNEVGGNVFDIEPYISLCSLDIICETAMGTSINAQERENSPYVEAVYNMKEIITDRLARPYLLSEFIFRLSKWSRIQDKSLKIIHNFTRQIIKERKAERQCKVENDQPADDDIYFGNKRRVAFLDMLLEASVNNEALTDDEIQEEVDTFMFEGHDTVTAAINFTLFQLGLHPDIQARVYEELRMIFGDSDRSASLKDLQDMKYLEMVIKEVLRLYPSVPLIAREALHDFDLGGYTVPAGTTMGLTIYILHTNPEVYPNPTKFDPDNFLPERVVKRHPYAYVPFSAGPRNCVGQKFAMLEMKTMLSSILRHYEVRSVGTIADLTLLLEIILRTKKGFRVTLHPRQK